MRISLFNGSFRSASLIKECWKVRDGRYVRKFERKASPTGYQQIKYGALYSDWRDMLAKGFKECFRVLKPGGFLIFKWNETDIKVSEVLKLTPENQYSGIYPANVLIHTGFVS